MALAAALTACRPSNFSDDELGTVGVSLEVAPGVTLASVDYAITGPGGFSQSGAIDGFIDESTQAAHAPANYPSHGTGIFFVGVEATGMVYAYALNHADSSFHRLAALASGHPAVMDLSFDLEIGTIRADCDDTCGNDGTILALTGGRFQVARFVEKPSTLPNVNNEGVAFAPLSECVNGQRSFFWSDDSNTGGHSLRRDTIPCAPLF